MAEPPRRGREDEPGRRPPPIALSLEAATTYRLGDPIDVTFSIRNSGSTPYQVLAWDLPLDGEVTDFLALERNGERVRFDGRHVKRGEPVESDYVLLEPDETIVQTVDISESYPIQAPGTYKATLKVTIFDAFPVPDAAKRGPRLRSSHEPFRPPPATVEFDVVPHGEPRETKGQAVRASLQQAKGQPQAKSAKAKAPAFVGGTQQQRDDTVIAHSNAQYYAALSISQLASTPGASNSLYDDWFGTFDQARYDKVSGHYASINTLLETEDVTYDFNGASCQPSYFAYTYSGSRTVWLCAQYLSAPQIGTDCKFGTLIHEWSHAVADTDDHAYGETNAGNLADTDPDKATDNADNHEYFSERLAQSDFGKSFTFITDRSQFGRDEVDALLANASPAVVEKAFYVHADGFWPDKLGITAGSLGSSPAVKPTLSVSPAVNGMTVEVATLEAEDPALPIAPQRFTWVLRVKFTSNAGFPAVANAETFVTITATLGTLTASGQIRLVKEASPFELDGATSWLSTDARVFQIKENESRFGATMGSTPAAASTFIKAVISNLDSGNTGGETFDASISTDQQLSALELSGSVGGKKVFNFAVAKVHYVGTVPISNVRAFFRLFPVSTTSTTFAGGTTYRRASQGGDVIATLGLSGAGDVVSIPCFAESRVDSSTSALTAQKDPANVKATMAASPPGGETIAYFGAWLDINQTAPQFPSQPSPADGPWSSGRKSVLELVKNAHQCLVAEISYDADPIKDGATPGGSDKLAQRNLAIVASANPGDPASHQIPNVFELWPAAGENHETVRPDELLIDWGNVPEGTSATVYIPEIDAAQIVKLANVPGRSAGIEQVDGQTISLRTGGISYVPLPPGAKFGLTGLLTVDLPETVKKGEVYTVVIRQVTDAFPRSVEKPPDLRKDDEGAIVRDDERPTSEARAAVARPRRWRRIAGSYQITIPVRTAGVLLADETRLLAVLRWILESTPKQDRWYPVFSRYVGLVADRVRGFGGDPDRVEPSPDGGPWDRGEGGENDPGLPGDRGPTRRFEGKIAAILYDCHGDFEGFVLDECGRERGFVATERRIEELVRWAWRDRITVSVRTRGEDLRRPVSITFLHRPGSAEN